MAEKKRILFVNQELAPYLQTSPQATLARDLMTATHGKGCEARTFMPKFGSVNERRNKLHEVIRLSGANIAIGDEDHPLILKVASLPPSRIQVYFIDNDDFFLKEDDDIDDVGSNRPDNAYRMLFYARGTADTIKKLKWEPHLIQTSGWFCAFFLPFMRKAAEENPSFRQTKLIYAVTDDELTTPLADDTFDKLKEDGVDLSEFEGGPLDTDFLHRVAISYADAVVFLNKNPRPQLEEWVETLGKPVYRMSKIYPEPEPEPDQEVDITPSSGEEKDSEEESAEGNVAEAATPTDNVAQENSIIDVNASEENLGDESQNSDIIENPDAEPVIEEEVPEEFPYIDEDGNKFKYSDDKTVIKELKDFYKSLGV